jgi:hypothetical protein
MALSFADCSTHAGRRAGWRCVACGLALCPACTGQRQAGTALMEVCTLCGGMADTIRERRALLHPFPRALPGALFWPLRGRGPIALVLWGVFEAVLGAFGGIGIARGTLLAYLFHVTRWTSHGHDDVPGAGDFRGFFEDIVAPLTRMVLATVWVTAPVVILLWGLEQPASSWLVVLFAVAGLMIAPISILLSAVETPLSQVINPLVLAAYAWHLGTDYLILLAFSALVVLLQVLLHAVATLVGGALAVVLISIVSMVMPFAFFRALGLLLRARGDDLGYGAPRDYLAPVLGAVPPQAGLYENIQGGGFSNSRHEASALERGTARAEGPHHDRAPPPETGRPEVQPASARAISLDDVEVASGAQAGLDLVRRLREGDAAGALDLLEAPAARDLPAITISAESWFVLGQAGVQQRRFPPALVALRRAIEVAPQGPIAPRAWLLAARVYDEGMQDRAESDRLLAELARRFPESQEGAFAVKRLAGGK